MPLKGVKCVLGYVSMAEHHKCMVDSNGPACGLEPTILQLMTRPNKEREDVVFSPSSLSNCHRRTVLAGKHDWFLDVDQGYKMVRGSIIHEGLGHEPPYPGVLGVVRELRMHAPINVDGTERDFKGKPDLVVLLNVETIQPLDEVIIEGNRVKDTITYWPKNRLHVKIVDYKTVSEVGHDLIEPRKDNVYQLNSYSWLVKKFLPGWLNWQTDMGWPNCGGCMDLDTEHLFMNEGVQLPQIDEIVVDELSLIYMDMKKTRTFTSKGFLSGRGKMKGDMIGGHWHRRNPVEYEELELMPIREFSTKFIESKIRKGIEAQIESETLLAPPLTDDRAALMCRSCPVLNQCVEVGLEEGYDMQDQKPYQTKEIK